MKRFAATKKEIKLLDQEERPCGDPWDPKRRGPGSSVQRPGDGGQDSKRDVNEAKRRPEEKRDHPRRGRPRAAEIELPFACTARGEEGEGACGGVGLSPLWISGVAAPMGLAALTAPPIRAPASSHRRAPGLDVRRFDQPTMPVVLFFPILHYPTVMVQLAHTSGLTFCRWHAWDVQPARRFRCLMANLCLDQTQGGGPSKRFTRLKSFFLPADLVSSPTMTDNCHSMEVFMQAKGESRRPKPLPAETIAVQCTPCSTGLKERVPEPDTSSFCSARSIVGVCDDPEPAQDTNKVPRRA